MQIVDLPGTYSLTSRAVDELIARNYILEEKPDVVVDIVDAANIERNLYLTMLLLELETNVIVVLNMWDIAENKGYVIDVDKLAKQLGVPVVRTIASRKEGMDTLSAVILQEAQQKRPEKSPIHYGKELEAKIAKLEAELAKDSTLGTQYPRRWLAIKLLEKDEEILKQVKTHSQVLKLAEIV